mmetsp:Transcript_75585/g.231302  ORF Transcript_75585/g.231302 Transcript_75585/m.231302 type:complete len:408 (-) Transcript_75585:443-1666(-)
MVRGESVTRSEVRLHSFVQFEDKPCPQVIRTAIQPSVEPNEHVVVVDALLGVGLGRRVPDLPQQVQLRVFRTTRTIRHQERHATLKPGPHRHEQRQRATVERRHSLLFGPFLVHEPLVQADEFSLLGPDHGTRVAANVQPLEQQLHIPIAACDALELLQELVMPVVVAMRVAMRADQPGDRARLHVGHDLLHRERFASAPRSEQSEYARRLQEVRGNFGNSARVLGVPNVVSARHIVLKSSLCVFLFVACTTVVIARVFLHFAVRIKHVVDERLVLFLSLLQRGAKPHFLFCLSGDGLDQMGDACEIILLYGIAGLLINAEACQLLHETANSRVQAQCVRAQFVLLAHTRVAHIAHCESNLSEQRLKALWVRVQCVCVKIPLSQGIVLHQIRRHRHEHKFLHVSGEV